MIGPADAIDLFLAGQDRPFPLSELSDLLKRIEGLKPSGFGAAAFEPLRQAAMSPETSSLRQKGLLLWASDDTQGAATFFAEAIGRDDVEAMLLFDATQFWLVAGQPFIARALFVHGCERSGEAEMPSVLDLDISVADSLVKEGEFGKAVQLLTDTLQLVKAKFGEDHEATFHCLHHTAVFFSERELQGDAAPYLREALGIAGRIYGDMHPETLRTAFVLARTLDDGGQLQEAAETTRGVLDRWKQAGASESLNEAMMVAQELKRLVEKMNAKPPAKKSWKSWW